MEITCQIGRGSNSLDLVGIPQHCARIGAPPDVAVVQEDAAFYVPGHDGLGAAVMSTLRKRLESVEDRIELR